MNESSQSVNMANNHTHYLIMQTFVLGLLTLTMLAFAASFEYIFMLWVYDLYKYVCSHSAEIDFRRHIYRRQIDVQSRSPRCKD